MPSGAPWLNDVIGRLARVQEFIRGFAVSIPGDQLNRPKVALEVNFKFPVLFDGEFWARSRVAAFEDLGASVIGTDEFGGHPGQTDGGDERDDPESAFC